MPSIEFSVYCRCGNGLCNSTSVSMGRSDVIVTVEPCEKCAEKYRDEGYDKGFSSGEDEGYDKGYNDGFKEGENHNEKED